LGYCYRWSIRIYCKIICRTLRCISITEFYCTTSCYIIFIICWCDC
jgi:hypothetical protein